jgi:hypothetical protein
VAGKWLPAANLNKSGFYTAVIFFGPDGQPCQSKNFPLDIFWQKMYGNGNILGI